MFFKKLHESGSPLRQESEGAPPCHRSTNSNNNCITRTILEEQTALHLLPEASLSTYYLSFSCELRQRVTTDTPTTELYLLAKLYLFSVSFPLSFVFDIV